VEKKLQFFDPELNENYIPYVVETSIGVDRMFLAMMSFAYQEEMVPDADGKESERVVLKLPAALAPVKVAVLPLVKNNEELTTKAKSVFDQLKFAVQAQYDEKDAIGRRYRRQDAIGTPFCVTVDFESLQDEAVTVRDRDTLLQVRLPIAELNEYITKNTDLNELLKKLA